MALKVLMLRQKLSQKEAALAELRGKDPEFETREKDLETAIGEAATEEEKQTVETAVETFAQEQKDHKTQKDTLAREIAAIESEIHEIEGTAAGQQDEKRGEQKPMEYRRKFFGLTAQERDAFFADAEVKEFLQRTRELGGQKRTVKGAELLIPTVVLELVKEQVVKASKLMPYVNHKPVPGKARQNVMGTIPEAVWTEMCGKLNELELGFSGTEVDGYKVGGYIAICNATLEDSDIALASELVTALGQAIGYALDKAILYGKGTKMPMGIMTRLAQIEEPANYPATARDWEDLHESNIKVITNQTGVKLFQQIVLNSGAAKSKYGAGGKFWAMSDTTFATLMSEAMSINAAGAIVTGQSGTMPVIGGDIVQLDFIPDGDIVGGYGQLYLLAERAGAAISQSEHARFIEDQTVFKGVARYDGEPTIAEGFVAMNIKSVAVSTEVTFAHDGANA